MAKTISVFGATGSIGTSFFKLIDKLDDEFEFEVFSGLNNAKRVLELANKYRPKLVILGNEHRKTALDLPAGVEVAFGEEALHEAASREVNWALNAVVGAAGLPVSLACAKSAQTLALANKESLVCGGQLLKNTCAQNDCILVPVDSEHSAIFQSLLGQDRTALSRIILTASGGPFRNHTLEEMKKVTLEDALNHPVWDMGARITIDSASMFNKALEMIEAHELFDLSPLQIDVVVHPQSIVHSFVEFSDQGQIAQLGRPDMQHAIGFALAYPKRLKLDEPRLDLAALGSLEFFAPDEERFPALRLAREVMEAAGLHAVALNAAKEMAIDRFIKGEIGFLDMAKIVEAVLRQGDWQSAPSSLSEIQGADQDARMRANKIKV